MPNYYTEKLSAERLRKCYDLSPPRIQQYHKAEIDFVLDKINRNNYVLDLGCGYGRVFNHLSKKTVNLFGIDISHENLKYGSDKYLDKNFYNLFVMNAVNLGFIFNQFDVVFCIQNGISAFKENPKLLIKEALRVTKPGGIVLFSSYSDKLWADRLEWFQIQAEHGFVGEIDYEKTKGGVIVCKDGFKATTFNKTDFEDLTTGLEYKVNIFEVDNSSIFCEIIA